MARPISKTTKFILALPKTLSAKEVLAKAKAGGLETSESNVHRVRRLHGGRSKKPGRGSASVASVVRGTSRPATRAEGLLRAIGAEIGLARAVEILESERARVRAVLGH
jgi:hypothetical protein